MSASRQEGAGNRAESVVDGRTGAGGEIGTAEGVETITLPVEAGRVYSVTAEIRFHGPRRRLRPTFDERLAVMRSAYRARKGRRW